jgi:hypothetical protein
VSVKLAAIIDLHSGEYTGELFARSLPGHWCDIVNGLYRIGPR